ncbi:MAG: M48 family metallopeptidase, partial [Deltaproteobacteria bacterium]|nr:M48 family metallopeptidase [Deltaproteobacteria bacterium]
MFPRNCKVILVLALGLTSLVAACATAPYTGRRQIILGSKEGEISTGAKTYEELRARNATCQDPAVNELVTRVGNRLAAAADRPDYHWSFVVLENAQETRAFCFPGGQAGIFTGALKYTRDEVGLATVLAHEAAHALARHTGERQSQATMAHMGGLGLGMAVGGVGGVAGQAIGEGYSLGIEHGFLPAYSGAQELEADKIGLILMAEAGYDPALAMDFWRRMMTDEYVKLSPPKFLSAHPRDDRHMQAMVDFLPEARTHYVPVAAAKPAAPPETLVPAPPSPGQPAPPSAPAAPSPPPEVTPPAPIPPEPPAAPSPPEPPAPALQQAPEPA